MPDRFSLWLHCSGAAYSLCPAYRLLRAEALTWNYSAPPSGSGSKGMFTLRDSSHCATLVMLYCFDRGRLRDSLTWPLPHRCPRGNNPGLDDNVPMPGVRIGITRGAVGVVLLICVVTASEVAYTVNHAVGLYLLLTARTPKYYGIQSVLRTTGWRATLT